MTLPANPAMLSSEELQPVAWQSRMYIGNQWTGWRDCEHPARFRIEYDFNFGNGTAELRPLYAAHPAPLVERLQEELQRNDVLIEETASQFNRAEAAEQQLAAARERIAELELLNASKIVSYRDEQTAELAAAREQIAELEERVEELEGEADTVSAEFERDCTAAMNRLLTRCHYERDVDGWTADDAEEYLLTTIDEIETAEKRQTTRTEAAEASLSSAHETIRAMQEALEPFAKLDMPAADKWTCGTFLIEHADIRRARAALTLAAKETNDGQ